MRRRRNFSVEHGVDDLRGRVVAFVISVKTRSAVINARYAGGSDPKKSAGSPPLSIESTYQTNIYGAARRI